jgi:hypothetical protein
MAGINFDSIDQKNIFWTFLNLSMDELLNTEPAKYFINGGKGYGANIKGTKDESC